MLADTNDELRLINEILADPQRFATPRLRQVADELLAIQRRTEARDPDLPPERALLRRIAPQAEHLGVVRKPDREAFLAHLDELDRRRDVDPGTHAAAAGRLAELHPDERPAAARELQREAGKTRRAAERAVATARRREAVQAGRIRERERSGEPIDSAEVRAARAELAVAKRDRDRLRRQLRSSSRRAGRAAGEASIRVGQADRRRQSAAAAHLAELEQARSAHAELLDQVRHHDTEAELAAARGDERARRDHAASAEVYRGRTARAQARVERLEASAPVEDGTPLVRIAQRYRTPAERRRVATGGQERTVEAELARADQRVARARRQLDEALAGAPRVPESMRALADDLAAMYEDARARRDQARLVEATVARVAGATRRQETQRLEPAEQFARRVEDAARAAGLEDPGYWASSPRPGPGYSLAAVGTGGRATHRSKRYTGSLFRAGLEEHSPDVLRRGVERNLKRRFSWALVTRNLDVHAFEWSRGRDGEGLTARQILDELDGRAIDPATVAILDSRIAGRRPPEGDGQRRGDVDSRAIDDEVLGQLHDEISAARQLVTDLDPADVRGQALNRYLVVPRDAFDELERATRPDGAATRMLEIVMKQKPARIMLGGLNLAWLTFQVASNAFLTGLAGVRNPLDVVNAQRWWKKLTPDQRDAIEPYLGIGYHHATDQPRLGSTTNSRFVNAWHAWQRTAVGRALHAANPLDLMFAADRLQNDFWRRTVFYTQAKRSAYRQMGASWKSIAGAQKKITAILKLPPERQARAVIDNADLLLEHADHVNRWLGNYVSFTANERRLLSRNVVFYGYLRHSLRLVFWTVPVEHPIMATLLADLGRMGAQEVKRILGVEPNYRLPTHMVAGMFFGGREAAKRGELTSIPVGRMNPFLNAATQMEGAHQAVGLFSPLFQMAVDQAFARSSFTGRDFRIEGQPTPSESQRPETYFGSVLSLLNPGAYPIPGVSEGNPRNRILLRDLLSLAAPYRAVERGGIPGVVEPLEGPQSDDSLLWDPRPMRYRDEDTRRSIERERERRAGGRGLLDAMLPFSPQPSVTPQIVERELEREAAGAGRRPRRRRRASGWGPAGTGGSSGSGWGPAAGTSGGL